MQAGNSSDSFGYCITVCKAKNLDTPVRLSYWNRWVIEVCYEALETEALKHHNKYMPRIGDNLSLSAPTQMLPNTGIQLHFLPHQIVI